MHKFRANYKQCIAVLSCSHLVGEIKLLMSYCAGIIRHEMFAIDFFIYRFSSCHNCCALLLFYAIYMVNKDEHMHMHSPGSCYPAILWVVCVFVCLSVCVSV